MIVNVKGPVMLRILFFVFLVLIPAQSRAEDEGLYDAPPPAGAVYVRMINLNPEAMQEYRAGNVKLPVPAYRDASAYYPVARESLKKIAVPFRNAEQVLKDHVLPEGRGYVTLVITKAKSGKDVIDAVNDRISTNKYKAMINFYNFMAEDDLDLKTGDGRITIAGPVPYKGVNGHDINGVRVDMAVYRGGEKLAEAGEHTLERGRGYSVMLFRGAEGKPEVEFFEARTGTLK